jgi:hypothetical protein
MRDINDDLHQPESALALISTAPVIVHLVHGTWPFGFFGRLFSTTKAWFEEGSEFRQNVEALAECAIDYREFRWPGENSVAERYQAAGELFKRIKKVPEDRPDAKHVIVAHSHGGTIAARALGYDMTEYGTDLPIKALICLASPFAYITQRRSNHFLNACYAIATALFAIVLRPLWNELWLLPTLIFITILIFSVIQSVSYGHSDPTFDDGMAIHPAIATFLIRATRDEATLTIGFVQSVNSLIALLYAVYDFRTGRLLASIIVGSAFGIVGISIFDWIDARFGSLKLDVWQQILLVVIFGSAAAGLLYVSAYALLAASVGFYKVSLWPISTIEVDSAPPRKECSIKCYSYLEESDAASLRHGIYKLADVELDVALVIRAVADQIQPRLATSEEMEEADDARRFRTRRQQPSGV